MNTDYRNAVDFYQAARYKGVGVDHDGEFFLRLVTAELRGGQIEAALQLIDEADFSGSISVSDRWRAEWNVAQALQASGELTRGLDAGASIARRRWQQFSANCPRLAFPLVGGALVIDGRSCRVGSGPC